MSIDDISLKKEKYLQRFFELYDDFLQIDAVVSVVKGREYNLILNFYSVFFIISKRTIPDDVDSKFDVLRAKLQDFQHKNEQYSIGNLSNRRKDGQQPNIRSTKAVLEYGGDLSKAFYGFVEATKQYAEWRGKLSSEAIAKIFNKNLEERNKFYGCQIECNTIKSPTNQNKILKQSLVELFNAISHLNAIYWNRAEAEKNKERAINHFYRGALDIYKAIIKDFFCLVESAPDETMSDIIDELKNVRRSEYNTTGSDNEQNKRNIRDEVIIQYVKFVEKIQKIWIISQT